LYGGKYKYVTGLEVDDLPKDSPKELIEEIAAAKEELEKYYGKGVLDSTNEEFWKTKKIVLNKKVTHLDFNIYEIAPSYDEAVDADKKKRWYLIEPEQFANINASDSRQIDKAISKLVDIDEEKTFDDMFVIHKVLITSDRGTTKQTPKSALYKDLSDFIHGKIVKTDKRKTPKQFLDAAGALTKDKKKLFVTAYVKDALYFNYLTVAEDGNFQNTETRAKYGATIDKAVAFLANPANQTELENVKERVEKKWSE
jgi:hypothetical protein